MQHLRQRLDPAAAALPTGRCSSSSGRTLVGIGSNKGNAAYACARAVPTAAASRRNSSGSARRPRSLCCGLAPSERCNEQQWEQQQQQQVGAARLPLPSRATPRSSRSSCSCSSGRAAVGPAATSAAAAPDCLPARPQRATASNGNSNSSSTPAPAVATTAAAAATSVVECGPPLPREQQQQQTTTAAPSALCDAMPCASHMWLPESQLWVPRHTPASAVSPLSPLGGGAAPGGGPMLARVFMASAATAGRKAAMEDRHVVAALHPERGVSSARGAVATHAAVSVAGVFDGHAGDATASFAAQHIPRLLHAALSGRPSAGSDLSSGPTLCSQELLGPQHALAAAFDRFDRWWADARCDPALTQHGWDDSGSTAVVGLVSGQSLVVANAGDSIALLAHRGTSRRLTEDHRLGNEAEAARVRQAGGRVVQTRPGAAPRVVGSSNQTRFRGSMVTRSLGDFAFKHPQPLISAEPHIAAHALEPSDRLVLLTSDGVSDVLPDDDLLAVGLDAIQQAQNSTNNGNALARAAADAVMAAAYASGSRDNITVVAMLLDWGGEYEEE